MIVFLTFSFIFINFKPNTNSFKLFDAIKLVIIQFAFVDFFFFFAFGLLVGLRWIPLDQFLSTLPVSILEKYKRSIYAIYHVTQSCLSNQIHVT